MSVYFNGLLLGLSLITALGPQNIFLIRQGASRNYTALSALSCFTCDLVLIVASTMGLQRVLEVYPSFQVAVTWFGVIFLLSYGLKGLYHALLKNQHSENKINTGRTKFQIIMLSLGFSLLNPHAIIDSLIIIGGGSSQYPGHQQAFVLGVITSSLFWFSLIASVTYYFSSALSQAVIWKKIELFSGILMLFLGLKLAYNQFLLQ